ncbi:MAG: PepSY domain-containing protein [Shewanella sp.]|uniref:PepSY domain-containing protein n=1 Tax=Shewanella sp. SNU WT4 TaxID=2590015 RepID=UPI00112ADB87|nr:hypothetical protein [Shewanella sp. SNU WT4]QDF66089.1 hypothetical protein FJQ87_04810 [Shewanella sp. SNU WT4]
MIRLVSRCLFNLSILMLSSQVFSQDTELHHYQAKQLVASGHILSLDDTLTLVSHYCDGKLIDAHLYQQQDKWRYDLQLKLNAGQLIDLSIDAKTGQPSSLTPLPSECQNHETVTR